MAKASDNEFPSVLFAEQGSAPTTPATGNWRAYFKSDGLYVVDDAGASTGPLGASGSGGGGGLTDWTYEPAPHRYGDTAREVRTTGTYLYYPATPDFANYAGGGGIYNSSSAQNDALEFYVWVEAGTYTLEVVGNTDGTRAIQTWALDDGAGTYATLGTLDWYAGSTANNVAKSLTSLAVTGSVARRKLRCKVATKNASASSYSMFIQRISLIRTA